MTAAYAARDASTVRAYWPPLNSSFSQCLRARASCSAAAAICTLTVSHSGPTMSSASTNGVETVISSRLSPRLMTIGRSSPTATSRASTTQTAAVRPSTTVPVLATRTASTASQPDTTVPPMKHDARAGNLSMRSRRQVLPVP